jgi:hypothetical protein
MSGSVFTTISDLLKKGSAGPKKGHIRAKVDMRRTEIAAYRGSESFELKAKREKMTNGTSKSFLMPTKYKIRSEDDAILMKMWLSFHDRKWLTFKRPLTDALLI